jgi:hypothetical protein
MAILSGEGGTFFNDKGKKFDFEGIAGGEIAERFFALMELDCCLLVLRICRVIQPPLWTATVRCSISTLHMNSATLL